VADICDPDRVRRQGVEGLRRFVARRGVTLRRQKAAEVVQTARGALRLPADERQTLGRVLAADLLLLRTVEGEIATAEATLAEILPETPAAVLLTLPGVAVVRASNYGAGIGDPTRFANAAAAYRASGLVPALYESAGRRRNGQRISREGSADLRSAIIELGRGLSQHDPEFGAYRRRLIDQHKSASVAMVAVSHRTHRLAFAMLRDQRPYDPAKWAKSVAAGRTVMAKASEETRQSDVSCPPPSASLTEGRDRGNRIAQRARG
jgi:transposase